MFKLFCFLMVHKLNVQPKRWKVIGKSYINDIFNKTIKMSPEGDILSEIEPWLD